MSTTAYLRSLAAALAITAAALAHAVDSPPAQAAATTQAAAPTSEAKVVVDNPYGLEALWKGGDAVAKGTLGILLLMSVGSWTIIITKLYEQYKLGRQADAAEQSFWSEGNVEAAIGTLDKKSAFHFVARSGADATARHKGILAYIDLNTWVTLSIQRAIDRVQSKLQDGLAFLATVGSTAPFVGLFGTVWGIYHALTAIGIAGQASIDKVAGPVGEALIMTAIGLAVAVPAVLGYNWLVRRNKASLERVRGFGAELHAVLLGAAAEDDRQGKSHPIRVVAV
ncbi:MotA/TolQ/ExbB proton channel family protein [Herbaspirillum sp. HC18]|nr:MotA/TolQ/ExbB proton channel family protein [Herbaspirillum sp. HC18]